MQETIADQLLGWIWSHGLKNLIACHWVLLGAPNSIVGAPSIVSERVKMPFHLKFKSGALGVSFCMLLLPSAMPSPGSSSPPAADQASSSSVRRPCHIW